MEITEAYNIQSYKDIWSMDNLYYFKNYSFIYW